MSKKRDPDPEIKVTTVGRGEVLRASTAPRPEGPRPERPRPERHQRPAPRTVTAIRLHRRDEPSVLLSLPATRSSTILVGRGESAELRVKHHGISRIHGFLRCDDTQWVYVDVGSANGSYVGAPDALDRLQPGQAVLLQPDQTIYLGSSSTWIEALEAMPQSTVNADTLSAAGLQFESQLAAAALSNLPVFLLGPSGSGKTWAAEVLHTRSLRQGRFIALNCASLPTDPTQLKSELLGHTRGAYTGADQARVGAFFAADGGTLFLDEVDSLSREAQGFLLTLLEDSGQLLPMGASQTTALKRPRVCVVSASKQPLKQTSLRTDLTYRLASGELIEVPSLRDRTDDIPGLVERFRLDIEDAGAVTFGDDAIDALVKAPWAGEIRELRATVQLLVDRARRSHRPVDAAAVHDRLAHLRRSHGPDPVSPADVDDVDQTRQDLQRRRPTVSYAHVDRTQEPTSHLPTSSLTPMHRLSSRHATREDVVEALRQTGGNIDRAATLLQWSRNTLTKKMDDFGLRQPRRPGPTE